MSENMSPQQAKKKDSRISPDTGDGQDQGAFSDSFSGVLRRHFRLSGISVTKLAHRSWLDIGYVSRLLNQDSDPLNPRLLPGIRPKQPSRDAVIRLGLGLSLALEDLDELLMAAGYAPLIR